jgi:hypothetical protein
MREADILELNEQLVSEGFSHTHLRKFEAYQSAERA